MINKNIKALSIFLILTVFILGAVSMVSAADIDAGVANATATGADSLNVSQNSATTAEGTINGILTTETASTGGSGVVPAGTLLNEAQLTFDGKVYYANRTQITTASVDTTNTITFYNTGIYQGVVAIEGVSDLDSTQTYYVGATLVNGKASWTPADETFTANIGTYDTENTRWVQTVYLPFKYISKYNITIADKTVLYGDDWVYTGTISDTKGPISLGTANIKLIVGELSRYSFDVPVINGLFTFNNTNLAFGQENLTAQKYKVLVTYDTEFSKSAELTVQPKNVTLIPSLNVTTAYYNDPSTLTVNLIEGGYVFKQPTTLDYTLINLNTGVNIKITDSTDSGKAEKVLTGIMPGNYIIRIDATSPNYNFQQASIYYNVSSVPTSIAVSESPLVVAKNGDGTITITIKDNKGNNLTVNDNDISVMVFDTVNVPVTTTQHPTDGKYTVSDETADNGYYLKIDYVAPGYDASSLSVPIVIKEGTTVTVTPNTATYTYGGNQNITVILQTGDVTFLNTTLVIMNGNDTIGVIPLTNGIGVYSLQTLNLNAADKPYNLIVKYLGDNNYKSSEAGLTVTVNPVYGLGVLRADKSLVNYNVTSNEVINFNLTTLSGSGILPYNGLVSYYLTNALNPEIYNITMTNGLASIAVKDLKELESGTLSYTFAILGNNRSNQVQVIISVKPLSGAISAENITANNDTEIIVSGKVINATDGNVTVTLGTTDGREIATYISDVAKDGSFEAQFASLKDGNYTALIQYTNGAIGLSNDDVDREIYITVEGASQPPVPPTPAGEIQTVLIINNFTEIVDAGKNLTGKLTDLNGTPIVGMHLTLRLTRLSNGQSKDYFTTTDYKGEFQFPINLAVGNYTAYAQFDGLTLEDKNITYLPSESPVTPFYVLPENKTEPTGNETTVIIKANPYVGVYGAPQNFTATFTNIDGAPLIGFRDCIEITLTRISSGASKTYTYFVPDYKGEVVMPVELAPGEYAVNIVFKGSTVPAVYDPATYNTTITVVRE